MRRTSHAAIVITAAIPFGVAWLCMAAALRLVLWADALWPEADRGNCWSFAGPRWWHHGGYMAIRPAHGVRLAGVGVVPHVLWLRELCGGDHVEQTLPRDRYHGHWLLWRKLYFRFDVGLDEPQVGGHAAGKKEAA